MDASLPRPLPQSMEESRAWITLMSVSYTHLRSAIPTSPHWASYDALPILGTHFMWENRDIRYNVLRAVVYFKGKPAAEDVLVLNGQMCIRDSTVAMSKPHEIEYTLTFHSDSATEVLGEDGE